MLPYDRRAMAYAVSSGLYFLIVYPFNLIIVRLFVGLFIGLIVYLAAIIQRFSR